MIAADLRTEIGEVRFRLGVRSQEDLVAGNYLRARTRNLSGHFVFKVGTHFQVLSHSDDKNLVEPLSFVLGIKPTHDDFEGFAIGRSKCQ